MTTNDRIDWHGTADAEASPVYVDSERITPPEPTEIPQPRPDTWPARLARCHCRPSHIDPRECPAYAPDQDDDNNIGRAALLELKRHWAADRAMSTDL
jgi:hypothetical protein